MKRLLLFILTSIAVVGMTGQNKFQPEWNVGIGFGPTISSFSLEPAIKTKSELRYHGGFAIRYISEKNLGLIGELNYSQQGWSQDFSKTKYATSGFAHTHLLDYLEMPILSHIYFGNKVRFFVNLGPKVGLLISEKETISESLQSYLNSTDYDDRDFETAQYGKKVEYKFDYGLLFGGGLELRSKMGHFALEGRYYLGLSDIYNSKKGEPFARSANRVISVKLTYYTKLF